MNGGLHDGVNAAEKFIQILNHGSSEDLLNLYNRQRQLIAIEYVQAQTIHNKKTWKKKTQPSGKSIWMKSGKSWTIRKDNLSS